MITHLGYDPEGPPGIMDEGVPWALFEDSQERFWISSTDLANIAHITRFNLRTGELDRYTHDPGSFAGSDRTCGMTRLQFLYLRRLHGLTEAQATARCLLWYGGRGNDRCKAIDPDPSREMVWPLRRCTLSGLPT